MKIFKNKVGRPTNEILKKRRIFKLSIILGVMVLFCVFFSLGYFNIINLRGYAAGNKITLCKDTKVYITDESKIYYKTKGTYYIWGSKVSNGRVRITKIKSFAGKKGLAFGWVNTSSLTSCSNASSTYKLGDVNMNGKVDATDSRLILQYVAGLSKLSEEQLSLADVNKDGKVTATDSRLILQIAAGLNVVPEKETDEVSISMTQFTKTWNVGDSNNVDVTLKDSSDSFDVDSSNDNVMKVSNKTRRKFKLTALSAGTSKITVKSKKTGQSVSYEYTVQRGTNSSEIAISMTKYNEQWVYGGGSTVKVTLKDSSDTYSVKSSNEKVMIITNKTNKDFYLKAIDEGTATITATSTKTGQTVSYTYNVKPYNLPSASTFGNKVSLSETRYNIPIYKENSCGASYVKNYLNELDVLNNKANYALKPIKGIYFVTNSTFNFAWKKIWPNASVPASDTTAVTGQGTSSFIMIKCDRFYKHTFFHEVAHAVDYRYYSITGTMLSDSLKNLYNKYKNASKKPLRAGYSYNGGVTDFYGDSFARYYDREDWYYPNDLKNATGNAIKKVTSLSNW